MIFDLFMTPRTQEFLLCKSMSLTVIALNWLLLPVCNERVVVTSLCFMAISMLLHVKTFIDWCRGADFLAITTYEMNWVSTHLCLYLSLLAKYSKHLFIGKDWIAAEAFHSIN